MKRLFLLLLGLFLLHNAEAQRFIGSAIFGGNISQVDGDMVAGYKKIGFNTGGSLMIALDRKQRFFITMELLYTQKGSYQKADRNYPIIPVDSADLWKIDPSFSQNNSIKYKLRFDYAEIPILFHYEDPRTGWAFGAGFAWGRLVYIKEIENGYHLISTVQSPDFWYKRNDWSVLADIKIRLYKGLKLNFRFQYSMVPVRDRIFRRYQGDKPLPGTEWLRHQYHNVISMRLIYSFNEKYVPNPNFRKGYKKGLRWMRDQEAISYK
ncbi:MAG: PorT family protein [Bacteroidales bacterium]|jgi:hypothetical protein|nr:PorT family protein [Bacteroidales bacterium]